MDSRSISTVAITSVNEPKVDKQPVEAKKEAYLKVPMNKKQMKARAASMAAKKARKINRKKRK